MTPSSFEEANLRLTRPDSMTDEECGTLEVHVTDEELISRWKLTWRERVSAAIFGTCWVYVVTGPRRPHVVPTHPPLALDVRRTVFGYTPIPKEMTWWKRQFLKLKYF